jgi:lauroyl/myristoyl acyltransferase
LRIAGRFDPITAADTTAAFHATVRFYERLVRERPWQWMLFDDVWPSMPAVPVTVPDEEFEPRRSLRR